MSPRKSQKHKNTKSKPKNTPKIHHRERVFGSVFFGIFLVFVFFIYMFQSSELGFIHTSSWRPISNTIQIRDSLPSPMHVMRTDISACPTHLRKVGQQGRHFSVHYSQVLGKNAQPMNYCVELSVSPLGIGLPE